MLVSAVYGVDGVAGGTVCQVGVLVQLLLLLAHVPVQAFGQALEPVRDLVLGADRRDGVDRHGHAEAARETRRILDRIFGRSVSLDHHSLGI